MQLTKPYYSKSAKTRLTNRFSDTIQNKSEILSISDDKKMSKLNIKVLMVEDDSMCQLIQKRILESIGCQVDIAGSGEEALAMFSSHYEAMILDVQLPDMSGFEVSKAIRLLAHGKYIPIIGLTSESAETRKKCLAAGYSQVIAKPADRVLLGRILQHYFPAKKNPDSY